MADGWRRTRHEVAPLGTRALLVRLRAVSPHAARRHLDEHPLPGQREVTAGASTLVVRFETARAAREAQPLLVRLQVAAHETPLGELVTIDTVYDGEDLDDVARLLDLDVDGVIRAHTRQEWEVAFVGFAPGFAYLRGQNCALRVPRRPAPRVRVPAGSVALAGFFSAIYPRTSPGGWQLIGRTDAPLWSLDRQPPLRLDTGGRVRFRAVRERVEVPEPERARLAPPAPGAPGLRVLAPGLQSLVEDAGRPGLSAWGVSRSGAADQGSLRQANRLVGNPPTAAVVENAGGGLAVEAIGDVVVAVTGADVPLLVATAEEDLDQPLGAPFVLHDGDVLEVGAPRAGLRAYLAVRGGVDAPEVLGSRSTDSLAALGVPPLGAGDELPIGPAPSDAVGQPEPPPAVPGPGVAALDLVPGPDLDWFDRTALDAFLAEEWTVTPRSDRVGVRLAATPIPHRREGELDSQGIVRGAIQVPPSGQPVLFLADHPATGGYPVIGVVADHHLDRAAQLPIGARVRFRATDDGTR